MQGVTHLGGHDCSVFQHCATARHCDAKLTFDNLEMIKQKECSNYKSNKISGALTHRYILLFHTASQPATVPNSEHSY